MVGETLVEKCRMIDKTDETKEKVNPTAEQISKYNLVLEEWQKRNEVVKDVMEGRTRFEGEFGKLFKKGYDDQKKEMIFQCIPGLKVAYDSDRIADKVGFWTGLAPVVLAAPKVIHLTRRSFLKALLIGSGAALGGVVVRSTVYFFSRPDTSKYNLHAKYLDNVVDSVRKK